MFPHLAETHIKKGLLKWQFPFYSMLATSGSIIIHHPAHNSFRLYQETRSYHKNVCEALCKYVEMMRGMSIASARYICESVSHQSLHSILWNRSVTTQRLF